MSSVASSLIRTPLALVINSLNQLQPSAAPSVETCAGCGLPVVERNVRYRGEYYHAGTAQRPSVVPIWWRRRDPDRPSRDWRDHRIVLAMRQENARAPRGIG